MLKIPATWPYKNIWYHVMHAHVVLLYWRALLLPVISLMQLKHTCSFPESWICVNISLIRISKIYKISQLQPQTPTIHLEMPFWSDRCTSDFTSLVRHQIIEHLINLWCPKGLAQYHHHVDNVCTGNKQVVMYVI